MDIVQPFLKWAGGKRWLVERTAFKLPPYEGRYIEPFLGGGAVFFHNRPQEAILSDLNDRLIESYVAIRDHPECIRELLTHYHRQHSIEFYYNQRPVRFSTTIERAAQFIYLNRTCWNGLYRENLKGQFNVPIGSKSMVLNPNEDFVALSRALSNAVLRSGDFEAVVDLASKGDLVFADPPYTTAHNFNGFVKYNERVFNWDDQVRLRDACLSARDRGATVIVTNANHSSVKELYRDASMIEEVGRPSVISGKSTGRTRTTECVIWL